MARVGPPLQRGTVFGLATITLLTMNTLILAAVVVIGLSTFPTQAASEEFGPDNPFFAPSSLPFQAPPFDKIKDGDYQPAMEAGMAQQRREVQAIANNPAPPTFENTFVALEKSGRLLQRVLDAFFAVTAANTNPELQKVRATEAPKLAAHQDAIYLDPKLFQRVATIYQQRQALKLDPESLRLVEYSYDQFVHAGAKLSDADKTELKKLNAELATLSNDFTTKLLAATRLSSSWPQPSARPPQEQPILSDHANDHRRRPQLPGLPGQGHRPRRMGPQGDCHRRARNARPDVRAEEIRGQEAARRGPDHGLAPHDDPDRGSHRDPGGTRGLDPLGVVQHLFDAGSRSGRDRQGRYPRLRMEGRDPRGVLEPHVEGPHPSGRQGPAARRRRRRRRHAPPPQGPRARGGKRLGGLALRIPRGGRHQDPP